MWTKLFLNILEIILDKTYELLEDFPENVQFLFSYYKSHERGPKQFIIGTLFNRLLDKSRTSSARSVKNAAGMESKELFPSRSEDINGEDEIEWSSAETSSFEDKSSCNTLLASMYTMFYQLWNRLAENLTRHLCFSAQDHAF